MYDSPFIQVEPAYGRTSPFATTVRFAQAGTSQHVAIEALDPEMGRLAAVVTARDGELDGDDAVGIMLDSTGDGRHDQEPDSASDTLGRQEALMSGWIVVLVVGLLGGIAAGLQGPLASVMAKQVGIMGSIFIIHLGGAIAAAALLRVPGAATLAGWREVPWYALSAGVLGLLLVGALSFCIPRIGAAATITLIIVAQLAVGALLDHLGLLVDTARTLDTSRLLGFLILLVGTWLVVR